jgi:tellurite methyltransferase
MGCGLGNLSIEAARRGCSALALDASPTAIARINRTAAAEGLSILAEQVDFETYALSDRFDTVVAIGLFMFFARPRALELLADAPAHTMQGGIAVVNVLIEGTTYLDMFEPGHYYLFRENELHDRFKGWEILESRRDSFPAPTDTTKEFITIVAKKIRDG